MGVTFKPYKCCLVTFMTKANVANATASRYAFAKEPPFFVYLRPWSPVSRSGSPLTRRQLESSNKCRPGARPGDTDFVYTEKIFTMQKCPTVRFYDKTLGFKEYWRGLKRSLIPTLMIFPNCKAILLQNFNFPSR